MTVDPATATERVQYGGRTYYFCSPSCRAAFQKEPERFLETGMTAEGHQHSERHHHS